jgi:hypothetical protein
MTDPDLVFDMDPQNVGRVEQWIAERWPRAALAKQADGSRLTWLLGPQAGGFDAVVATESFMSLAPAIVDGFLKEARVVCEMQSDIGPCYLLLSVDGARLVAR